MLLNNIFTITIDFRDQNFEQKINNSKIPHNAVKSPIINFYSSETAANL